MTDPSSTDESDTDFLVDDVPFSPLLDVSSQDGWKIVRQERTAGDVQTIYLDPDQARQVGWALLAQDDATADDAQAVAASPFVNEGGRFS